MSTFKFEFKMTGLEVKVESDRADDHQRVAGEISKVVSGIVEPAMRAVANADRSPAPAALPAAPPVTGTVTSSEPVRSRRARAPRAPSNAKAETSPLWKHEPSKWGTPQQTWTIPEKSIWLLRVAEAETGTVELSMPEIAQSFNAMFRETGAIVTKNPSRDLAKFKKDGLIGHDPKTQKWYLTTSGKSEADRLIEVAKTAIATKAAAAN